METVTILRELWHRRLVVGALAVVALIVGLAFTHRSYEVSIATSRILVDTPASQVVDVAPRGSDTLGVRANLLANLMTEGDVKAAIADRAGIPPRELTAGVETGGELPAGLASAQRDPGVRLLTTSLIVNPDGDALPLIEIEAQAPDAVGAAQLASAAVEGLDDYLDSKAAAEQVSDARRLSVTGLGASQVRQEVRGPGLLIGFGVAALAFVAGCIGIVIVSSLARRWRASSEAERLEVERLEAERVGPVDGPTLHIPFEVRRSGSMSADGPRAPSRPRKRRLSRLWASPVSTAPRNGSTSGDKPDGANENGRRTATRRSKLSQLWADLGLSAPTNGDSDSAERATDATRVNGRSNGPGHEKRKAPQRPRGVRSEPSKDGESAPVEQAPAARRE